jgi:hypothetical protein
LKSVFVKTLRLFQNFSFERATTKKSSFAGVGRKTARASAKPTGFCKKLDLLSCPLRRERFGIA